MSKKIYLETYGCDRRKLEATKVRRFLKTNEYQLVSNPKNADTIIVSTCAFIKKEEDRAIRIIKHYLKTNKEVLVLGCLPDIAPNRFNELGEIYHLAPKDLENIDQFFEDGHIKFKNVKDSDLSIYDSNSNSMSSILRKTLRNLETSREFVEWITLGFKKRFMRIITNERAYHLNIGKGCKGKCTYCGIKFAIGDVVSKPPEDIIKEFRQKTAEGYNKIVLTADDVGAYGLDMDTTFPHLISLVLEEARLLHNGSIKLSIKELHPKWIIRYGEELCQLLTHEAIKELLCPIESGSDRILDLMKREHNVDEFYQVYKRLREINPNIHWYTQIIVGFPSESIEDFTRTVDFIIEAGFDSVILFPYHEVERVPSKKIEGKVTEKNIRERIKLARRAFRKKNIKTYLSCPD